MIDSLSTTPESGGIVSTVHVDEVDVDSVVDAVPKEAKAALRQHLRKTLTDLEKGKFPTDLESTQPGSEVVQGTPVVPVLTTLPPPTNELERDACELLSIRSTFRSLKSYVESSG